MILLLSFLIALVVDLTTDTLRIRAGRKVIHGLSALLRSAGLFVGAYLEFQDWWLAGVCLVSLTAIYWIVFDLLLNLIRSQPLLYNGTTSVLDRILLKAGDEWELVGKGFLVVASVAAFFMVKKRRENDRQ